MENTSQRLSFGQRNWLVLCIVVAILSPLVVHTLNVAARKKNYNEAIHTRKPDSSQDTSYHVASPPQNQGSNQPISADSAKH